MGNDTVASVDNVDFSDDLPECVARAYANSQLTVLNSKWKPVSFDPDSYKRDRSFRNHTRTTDKLSKSKRELFRELYSLRDEIAREQDESPSFVIPSAALCAVVDRVPQDLKSLSQCWWPLPLLFLDDEKSLSKIACRFLVKIKAWLKRSEDSK